MKEKDFSFHAVDFFFGEIGQEYDQLKHPSLL